MPDTLNFKRTLRARCPCGTMFEVGKVTLENSIKTYAILHEEPHCKKFEDLEVDAFLHWVNVMHGEHN